MCFHSRNKRRKGKISEHIMFEAIMQHSMDSIYFKDLNSRFIYNNKYRAEKHGIEKSAMIGKTDFDLFYQRNAEESLDIEQEIAKTGRPVIGKIEKLSHLNGKTTWSSASKYPLYNRRGRVIGTWGISRDITEYEMAKEALRLSEAKHKAMIANITDVIAVISRSGPVTYISPNINTLFGWTPEEITGSSLSKLIIPLDPEANLDELITPTLSNSVRLTECLCRRKDGTHRTVRLTAVNLTDNPDIGGILINFHDITESKQRENEILYLSYHDALTGLYNRAFFDEEKKCLDMSCYLPLSIIMGDVNDLKVANDTFGHNEGDKLLVAISQTIKTACRKNDIAARTGGDEFCVLLPCTPAAAAQAICERIQKACREYDGTPWGRLAVQPGIALGCATKTSMDQPIDRIQKKAEDGMYQSKILARNSAHGAMISSIKTAMSDKSQETADHSDRMLAFSRALGRELCFSEQQLTDLDLLSMLHDIGKICIRSDILSKPGVLSDEDWEEIRRHPEEGCRIAQAALELTRVAEYIRCHHERWDGTGYPAGLSGEEIPLHSRIIAVVDAYDAMTHNRPYRKALAPEVAVHELVSNAGTQFDPVIARVFVEKVLGKPWQEYVQ